MNTPSSPQPSSKSNVIHLTQTQGLLLLAGLTLLFGGLIYWSANRFPRSYSGSVTYGETKLVPFGCSTARAGNTLTAALRPDPQPQGFHEENRAIILNDGSTEGTTTKPRAVDVTQISWRDESGTVTPMTCQSIDDQMTVFSKRRGGIRRTREDVWSGTIKATCEAPGIGAINIDLDLQNCQF